MSEKQSKGYDPTQARMVGNILAGNETYQKFVGQGYIESASVIEKNVILATNRVIKALKKEFEG